MGRMRRKERAGMRRFLKRQIMEKFLAAAEKHKQIKQMLLNGEFEAVQNFLVQCQEAVFWAGNAIEESEGTVNEELNRNVIHKLEEYCEMIYQLSVEVAAHQKGDVVSGNPNRISDIIREADACLCGVREYISEHIDEKLEVAFFPYKASMWDSLESVWMAAKEDKTCECYVVPIPYFDKNPDGTVAAMHYEGTDFPEYVPIIDWQKYNPKERHPDIAFIHNPYDYANKVTSVHLDFYAKELKKCTDMLVYIPYFVCINDNLSEEFCVLPGTMYADKIIVQSEKVRQGYIREFHKFEQENHCEGMFGIAEDKFVALGSPKYDKVLRTTRDNVKLPKEWSAKIRREDGSLRKVILYNTSIAALLKSKEQGLKKIHAVFDVMRDREDVVLLWRPHPLSEATYSAMEPQLAEKYRETVKQYKQEGWGIYDDTPDLHRAIAISDAYYGDSSSLVELYRVTGKPIMIQSVEIV